MKCICAVYVCSNQTKQQHDVHLWRVSHNENSRTIALLLDFVPTAQSPCYLFYITSHITAHMTCVCYNERERNHVFLRFSPRGMIINMCCTNQIRCSASRAILQVYHMLRLVFLTLCCFSFFQRLTLFPSYLVLSHSDMYFFYYSHDRFLLVYTMMRSSVTLMNDDVRSG